MIKKDLQGKRVYIDSGIFIYLLGGFDSKPLIDLKDMIAKNEIEVSFCKYAYTEILFHSIRKEKNKKDRKILLKKIAGFLKTFNPTSVSAQIGDGAGTFGGRNGINSLSAINVISAVANKCEVFLTNDSGISIVPDGLKLIQFSDYENNLDEKPTV